MTTNNYDPTTSLDAYFTSRAELRTARVWSREKVLHDWADLGAASFFEGDGDNPTTLTGYAKSKLWLRVDPGVTATPGTVRYYGGGDPTLLASWPVITKAAFVAHTAARGSDMDYVLDVVRSVSPAAESSVSLNHATNASVTTMFVSRYGRNGVDYGSRITAWAAGDRVRLYAVGDESKFVEFTVGVVTAGTNSYSVSVTHAASTTLAVGSIIGIEHTPIGAKTGIDFTTAPTVGNIVVASSASGVETLTTEEFEALVEPLVNPSTTEFEIKSALGYLPARIDGQYLVISAPYHFVRPDQLHLTHLAATAGLKILNLRHLPRGSLLKARVDHTPTFQMAIDIENNGRIYGLNPRNGQGVATNLDRAARIRPDSIVAIRVRTQGEIHVEYQSRETTTIVIPTVPSGVTSHEFECSGGFYKYTAQVRVNPSSTMVLTLPTVDAYPASGNFPGLDAVRRWDTTLAVRNIDVQVLNNGAFGAGFIPPHPGALMTVGNDTTLTIYNNSTAVIAVLVSVGKLLPVLTTV